MPVYRMRPECNIKHVTRLVIKRHIMKEHRSILIWDLTQSK